MLMMSCHNKKIHFENVRTNRIIEKKWRETKNNEKAKKNEDIIFITETYVFEEEKLF